MTKCAVIDFETLGLKPDTKVLSVGIAAFELEEFVEDHVDFKPNLYFSRISQEEQENRTTDQSTIDWWTQQTESARKLTFEGIKAPPKQVLVEINEFLLLEGVQYLFGNGKEFDNVIWRNMCEMYGIKPTLGFWTDMDLRTLQMISMADRPPFPAHLIQHVADHDAIHEAYCATYYYNKIAER